MSTTQTTNAPAPVYPVCEIPGFSLGCGHLGNGLTIWNRAVEVNRDYPIVAHISEDGEVISWRVKNLPQPAQQYVLDWAAREKNKYAEKKAEEARTLELHKEWLLGQGYTEEQINRVRP